MENIPEGLAISGWITVYKVIAFCDQFSCNFAVLSITFNEICSEEYYCCCDGFYFRKYFLFYLKFDSN